MEEHVYSGERTLELTLAKPSTWPPTFQPGEERGSWVSPGRRPSKGCRGGEP